MHGRVRVIFLICSVIWSACGCIKVMCRSNRKKKRQIAFAVKRCIRSPNLSNQVALHCWQLITRDGHLRLRTPFYRNWKEKSKVKHTHTKKDQSQQHQFMALVALFAAVCSIQNICLRCLCVYFVSYGDLVCRGAFYFQIG